MSPDRGKAAFLDAVDVSRETLARLERYVALLESWNRRINLVSRRSLDDVWRRHILDSAQLAPLLPADARVLLDLGSGAGFPGLVLALLRPALAVHLLEADQRKAAFLREACRISAVNATVHDLRLEDLAPFPVDVVTARAFAPLTRLLELSQLFHWPETLFLLPKGQDVERELTEAAKCWNMAVERHGSLSDPRGVILSLQEIARDPRV